jgi:uncharacterized protein YjbI with pentapeptide repeats
VERDNLCIFHVPKNSPDGPSHVAVNHKAEEEKFQQKFTELLSETNANHTIDNYDFRGFNFPHIPLSKITFKKEAHFQEAIFASYVSFYDTIFRKRADFYDAVFEWGVSFTNCTFNQEAYFLGSTFKESSDFGKTTFEQTATFSAVTFSKSVSFHECTFHRDADFRGSTISGKMWFIGDVDKPFFLAECDFTFLRLDKGDSLVFEKVNLGMARFLDTNLDEIVFRDIEWRFRGHQEEAYPLFTIASILDWPDFMESLKQSVSLQPPMREYMKWMDGFVKEHPDGARLAEFLRGTSNLDAPDPKKIIRDSLSDQSTNIVNQYERAQSLDEASKASVIRDLNAFLEKKDFYNEDSFHSVYPNDEAKALLEQGADKLSNKTLARLNRLLIEAVFPYDIAKSKMRLRGRKQHALWDEFRPLEDWEAGREYGKIAENYSQLVLNYERKRDFETAEDFHVGEMEMRRKKKGLKSPHGWKRKLRETLNSYSVYRALNNYGTSYWQALIVLVGMILFISWIFLFTGLQPARDYSGSSNRILDYDFALNPSRWVSLGQFISDYFKSVSFTLSTITFQRERTYEPAGDLSRLWLSIASVALASQIALILLAIRRRFKR